MKTLIRHLACDEPIYVVDRVLNSGDPINAAEWHPLSKDWPQPKAGDEVRCPNCGAGFLPSDRDLQRVVVEDW